MTRRRRRYYLSPGFQIDGSSIESAMPADTSKTAAELLPPPAADVPLLFTTSELRDRKTKRRLPQQLDLPRRLEPTRRLVELGLKAKTK